MGTPAQQWTEERVELVVATILRAGVALSSLVVLVGGILYLVRYGSAFPHHEVFRGEPEELRAVPGIFQQALALHSRGMIQLGLLLLIATPVARVAFSIFGFAMERDRKYVVITLIVFCVLVYSLAFSR